MDDEANQTALRALWQLATELDDRSLPDLIDAGWFHGSREVLLPDATLGTYHRDPALLYAFSRQAFQRYFRDTLLFSEALQEVCQRAGYTFDVNDRKAWQEIHSRPELTAAARRLLATDTDFVFSILERVTVRTGYYMRYITAESIQQAVEVGIELLIARVKETPIDDIRYVREEESRSADERHQEVVNIANRFAGSVIPKPLKKRWPKEKGRAFNYEQLCSSVYKLGDESGPPQLKNVARDLRCSNLNRLLRDNKERLTQVHGHSSHIWSVLALEIWERRRKN